MAEVVPATVEDAAPVEAVAKDVNGHKEEEVNGHKDEKKVNGVEQENGVEEESAPADQEPATKKVKKMKKEQSGNRRSSSRLVNIDTGKTLPKEISSENLESIKKGVAA